MPSKESTMNTSRVKRHRHGYRGYGSALHRDNSGAIHWGRGFGGVGVPEEGRILSLRPDVISQVLRDRLSSEDDTPNSSK
jgi:hypothetical protein